MVAGSSVPALAEKVANHLGVELMKVTCGRFSDGEVELQLQESARNTNIFVLQSTCPPVNENLMELFFITRCLRRASAKSITAVIPYFGYARQDRKMSARVPISASDVAMLLESAGVDRVLAIDLHCGQIQGFFHNTPVDNLSALRDFTPYISNEIVKNYGDDPVCIVSPDAGGVARAKQFLEALTNICKNNISLAITVKHRSGPGEIEGMNVVGEIEGKHCIIVDDMIDTAGTLCKSAETLRDMGAKSVSACATHALFNGPALDRIAKSVMEHVIISDTIPLKPEACDKIKVVSSAALLAEAIMCCQYGKSVSGLFQMRANEPAGASGVPMD
jgi:ribose-phosphate pyrophosphokinase